MRPGVTECYDYSHIGPDLLRQLVADLGLRTVPTNGGTDILNGRLLRGDEDIRTHCGGNTIRAIHEFRARAAAMLPVEAWQGSDWQADSRHPWAGLTCEEVLSEISDPAARQYLKIASHSDLAAEPYSTNGLNALKNFLMALPGLTGQGITCVYRSCSEDPSGGDCLLARGSCSMIRRLLRVRRRRAQ
jgi:hypothetical protein